FNDLPQLSTLLPFYIYLTLHSLNSISIQFPKSCFSSPMARTLSFYLASAAVSRSSSASFRCLALRSHSNLPNSNAADPASADESSTDPLLRKLEDAIHRIIVRRTAPDWLPFVPGSSYWVPPPRSTASSYGIAQLVEKLANPLTDEESLSVTTVRGWPSSDYFIKGASFDTMVVNKTHDVPEKDSSLDQVETDETSTHSPKTEAEEG
ncbi:hypothetical protein LINGRAHAP2_LOCUS2695, partial [Linum grandiflorum]